MRTSGCMPTLQPKAHAPCVIFWERVSCVHLRYGGQKISCHPLRESSKKPQVNEGLTPSEVSQREPVSNICVEGMLISVSPSRTKDLLGRL